jgi:Tfp pilus assembly protein PilN
MSARRIAIDFAPRRLRWSALAVTLLIAAGALVVGLVAYQRQAGVRLAGQQSELAALERSRSETNRPRVPAGSVPAERVRAVNDAIRRLNLPWDTIFAALAAVAHPHVALLSLQPQPQAGTIKLAGEAKTIEAMLAYQRRLESRPEFESALLTRHEIRTKDAGQPVRFWIDARWRATP